MKRIASRSPSPRHSPQRLLALVAAFAFCLPATSLLAKPIPDNLASGLDKLVESNVMLKEQAAIKGGNTNARFNGYATQQAADYANLAIQDTGSGRFLVDIHPSGRVSIDQLVSLLQT